MAPEVTWLHANAHQFSSTDPANEDYSDLKDFGDAVGNARIVSLAEPDHGSGTVFNMKTRLVKYLHEKKGFDVLMIESSLFSVNRIWQQAQAGQNVDDLAPDNIFYMYSKSAEGRKVLQYIDAQRTTANPLMLSSFETSGTGASSELNDLFPMLEAFLGPRGSAALTFSDWATYKDVMLKTVIPIPSVVSSQPQASINATLAVSDQLESELCPAQADTYVFPDSPGIWCLVVKGLRSSADNKLLNHYTRDVAAPANFKWLDDHLYSGHKIILWAHYAHLGRGTQSPAFGGSVNMGSLLDSMYGKQMYVVAFTSSVGNELAWWEGARAPGGGFTIDTVPIEGNSADSVENALRGAGHPNLFVDARSSAPPSSIANLQAKVDGFVYGDILGFTPNTLLGTAYDGLFYIETSRPATINR